MSDTTGPAAIPPQAVTGHAKWCRLGHHSPSIPCSDEPHATTIAAFAAAWHAFQRALEQTAHASWLTPERQLLMRRALSEALEAAAPHLAAAERERCAQLLHDYRAVYFTGNQVDGLEQHPAVDLLREQP